MIGQEQQGSLRRWGLPLGVAAVVSATSVIAALALGSGPTKTSANPGSMPAPSPTAAPTLDGPAFDDACKLAQAKKEGKAPPPILGTVPPDIDPALCTGPAPTVEPTNPEITAPPLTPLSPARTNAILTTCAPTGGPWQPVLAMTTAIPTPDEDAMVIGTNTEHQYVFCSGLGNTGRSTTEPTITTMASMHTGNNHLKEYSATDFSDRKNYLMLTWGLAGPEVARVTVSYGYEKREAPALLSNGAYLLSVSTPYNAQYTHPPIAYVHAYAADGTKLYDTPVRLVQ
ncbi:MAG: hypothetical protein HOW97_07600 [Catenulispora sp.]|nr:hypothetical protein [Catenulispora sp.]